MTPRSGSSSGGTAHGHGTPRRAAAALFDGLPGAVVDLRRLGDRGVLRRRARPRRRRRDDLPARHRALRRTSPAGSISGRSGSGQLRPIDERDRTLPRWVVQVWMREHALAPWQLDVVLNPGTSQRVGLQARPQRDPPVRRGDLGRRRRPALPPAGARARPQGRAEPPQGRCRSCRRPAVALGRRAPVARRVRRAGCAGAPLAIGARGQSLPSPAPR